MQSNKTIVFGITAVIFLAGVVWYASNYGQNIINQAAFVLGSGEEQPGGVILGEEFFLGSPDASVTIIGYSSHFCGHCANFHNNTLPLIMDEYIKSGQVKFISRLLSPPELSMAVLCAQDQGKFQEFNQELFKSAGELNAVAEELSAIIENEAEFNIAIIEAIADYLKTTAGDLGLNQDEFDTCFDLNKHQASAEKWFEQAQEAGVEGIPAFFVNDRHITGNQPYNVFKSAIKEALAK